MAAGRETPERPDSFASRGRLPRSARFASPPLRSRRLALLVLGVLVPLILWQLGARRVGQELILPGPPAVLAALVDELVSAGFLTQVGATSLRAVGALIVATLIALPLAGLAARAPVVAQLVHPTVVTMRSVPFISVTLVAVIWFPSPIVPPFVAVLMALPLIYESSRAAFSDVDPNLVEMMRVFRTPWLRRVRHLWLPGAATGIWAGTRAAAGIVWKVTVAAEVIGRPARGIGALMSDARLYLEIERVLAWTVVLVVVAGLFDGLLRLIEAAGTRQRRPRRPASTVTGAGDEGGRRPTSPPAIELRGVSVAWPRLELFGDLDLALDAGGVTALLGPSGSGKTTLLRVIAGVAGRAARVMERRPAVASRTAMVFQDPRLLPWRSARRNICCATGVAPARADEQLARVDLLQVAENAPRELSGGMQQRVALARALAADPTVLLVDEPLTGVDPDHRDEIVTSLERVLTSGRMTTVVATHDLALARRVADRVLVLGRPPHGFVLDLRRPQAGWGDDVDEVVGEAIRRARGR